MSYVLIIISFVAMGGPKATTPIIDHLSFASQAGCESAKTFIDEQLVKAKVRFTSQCQVS